MTNPDWKPLISIIIPTPLSDSNYTLQCINQCLLQSYANFEILVVGGNPASPIEHPKVRYIQAPPDVIGPGVRRDLAARHANGDLYAFIDADAYPDHDWLMNAVELFHEHPTLAALGGPGVTPPDDSFFQKANGAVMESFLGFGPVFYRNRPAHPREVREIAAFNLFVKKEWFIKAGGFDTNWYGCEDIHLCNKILAHGGRMFYSPKPLVFHHRKNSPVNTFLQIFNMAKKRAMLIRQRPRFRDFLFCLPLLSCSLLFIVLSSMLLSGRILDLMFLGLISYFILVFYFLVDAFHKEASVLAPIELVKLHLAYGLGVLFGFIEKD